MYIFMRVWVCVYVQTNKLTDFGGGPLTLSPVQLTNYYYYNNILPGEICTETEREREKLFTRVRARSRPDDSLKQQNEPFNGLVH